MGHVLDYIKRHKVLLLVIIPAFFLHMLVIMPSGTNLCIEDRCGLHFWGVNNHDAIWHLEIAAVSFKQLPFIVPTYAGATLSGYNIFMDFVIFLISWLGIHPSFTYFKILPIIWFFFYTVSGVMLARKIKDSKLFVGIFLFFIYFAGHLGYFLTWYHSGKIFGGNQSFAIQSATYVLNLQFALSLPLLMYMLVLILDKKWTVRRGVILSLLAALILSLKFYGGVIAIFLVGMYIVESFIHTKSVRLFIKQSLAIILSVSAVVIVFYNPFQSVQSGSIFKFAPFSIVHAMIEEKDMAYNRDWVMARYYLYEHGISPRLIYIELMSSLLYIFFNFGVRFLGFIYVGVRILLRKVSRLEVYVLTLTLLSISLTIALIQKGEWWNTVQFMYYGIFLSNVFVAALLYQMCKKAKIYLILPALVIIVLALPMNIDVIRGFTSKTPAYLAREEIEAMKFLKDQPDGVVFHSFEKQPDSGYNYYDYSDTGYIAAYTGKQLYFGHRGPLTIIGVDFADREKKIKNLDCSVFKEIDYIYYVMKNKNDYITKCGKEINQFKQSFDNTLVKIYKKI